MGFRFLFCLYLLCSMLISPASSMGLQKLEVEYNQCPSALDVTVPRFGWQLVSNSHERGIYQTAYQLEVKDEAGKVVWNSGKVPTDVSQHVTYQGKALKPATRYIWKVKIWNNKGEIAEKDAWFETSLMTSDDKEGWNGARWIGGSDEDMVLYSHYLPVFRLDCSFQMKKQATSRKISFVYGANDERLMNANQNIYHIASGKDESYIKVEFDLSLLKDGRNAWIHIYRAGYQPDDKPSVPLKSFMLPVDVLNAENQYQLHTFSLYSNLGFTTLKKGEVQIGEVNLNPIRFGSLVCMLPLVVFMKCISTDSA